MCIGIPMCVLQSDPHQALCQARDDEQMRQVNMLLVGEQPVGTWVLVFLDCAREVLDELTAHQISDALQAVGLAMQGEQDIDHLFADLVDREPQLPDFLQPAIKSENS